MTPLGTSGPEDFFIESFQVPRTYVIAAGVVSLSILKSVDFLNHAYKGLVPRKPVKGSN